MVIITTILFGLARGLYEGMVMTPGGVREHVAFYMYHALGFMMLVAFGRLVYLLYKKRVKWLYVVGLLLILWECTEIGYGCSRFGYIKSYEHVVFADIIDFTITGTWVWMLHAMRVVFGALACWSR